MVKIMIDIISYSVTALLFWYYARTLFGSKYKVPVQLLCTFAVFGILMALNQFSNPFINYSSWFVLDLLLLIFVYQVRLKSAVLHAFLFPLIVLAGEFIDIILYSSVIRTDFNYVNSDMTMYGVVNFLSKLFLLTFVIILIRIFSKDKNIRTRNYLSIAIVPMTNAIIMLVFRYITIEIDVTSTIFYLWMAAVVLLMVSSIFVFVNYHTTLKKSKELSDLKLEQQKNETDFAYLKLLEQKNEDMRIMQHDFNKHLSTIKMMSDEENVHMYVDKLLSDVRHGSDFAKTHNKILDVIIGKYVGICEEKGIAFEIEPVTQNFSFMEQSDIAALFNNLLENAVESAEQTEQKKITLSLSSAGEKYAKIVLYNTCAGVKQNAKGEFVSTKADTSAHGIGLKSIAKVIKKFGGNSEFSFDPETKQFKSVVLIPH